MNLKRTTSIALMGAALLAWLAGAATSTREPVYPAAARRAPVELKGADFDREVARLHDRLRPDAAPLRASRNLFQFSATKPAAPTAVAPAALPAPEVVNLPAPPPSAPPMTLAGIAEDPGDAGVVRTAIVSMNGQVILARVGDPVTPRYKVTAISGDVVELTDTGDGTTRRLALK